MKAMITLVLDLDEAEAAVVPREAQRLPRPESRAVLSAALNASRGLPSLLAR